MTDADFHRLESKVDLLLNAMGLSDKHRAAPCQIKDVSNKIVLQFLEKERKSSATLQGGAR